MGKNNKHTDDLAQTLVKGIRLSRLRLLQEKALRNECVVIAEDDGTIKYVPAKKLIAEAEKKYKQAM